MTISDMGLIVDGDYDMEEAVGIALNGVLFKPAAHADGYDVIFPRVKSGKTPSRIRLDQCLGTTEGTFVGSD